MVGAYLRNAYAIHQFATAVVASYNSSTTISGHLERAILVKHMLTLYKATAGYILQAPVLTSALMLAFIYTYAQDNRGQKAHFIILQIPVEFLPWAMLTLALIMGGFPAALQQGTGILAAHLYDFLTRLYPTFQGGRNYIQTPAAIKRLFGAEQTTTTVKGFGTAIRPGQAVPQQRASTGWGSGLSGSWGGRGQGRRLGGE
jgi:Derlin-2/3